MIKHFVGVTGAVSIVLGGLAVVWPQLPVGWIIVGIGAIAVCWSMREYFLEYRPSTERILDWVSFYPIVIDFPSLIAGSWEEGRGLCVSQFWLSCENRSSSFLALDQAVILSRITGARLPMKLRTSSGYVDPVEANAIPPKAKFYLQALLYDPSVPSGQMQGIAGPLFFREWAELDVEISMRGKKAKRRRFTAHQVARSANRAVPQTGSTAPRVTTRAFQD
ncbi:hypothetical protein [Devosia sp.]|uniref:hypothetical protein n=1 Tax=Devosia sp. TaxID=1871048 RepID=UPI001AC8C648|nr:hypothetical protein [Devosia sp.]MBN9335285.1 hypothetical protein [Devosia sp.]